MAVAVGIHQNRFGFFAQISCADGIDPFAVFAGIAAAQQYAGFVVGNDIAGFQRAVIDTTAQVAAALVERVCALNDFNSTRQFGIDALARGVFWDGFWLLITDRWTAIPLYEWLCWLYYKQHSLRRFLCIS